MYIVKFTVDFYIYFCIKYIIKKIVIFHQECIIVSTYLRRLKRCFALLCLISVCDDAILQHYFFIRFITVIVIRDALQIYADVILYS